VPLAAVRLLAFAKETKPCCRRSGSIFTVLLPEIFQKFNCFQGLLGYTRRIGQAWDRDNSGAAASENIDRGQRYELYK